MIETIEDRDIQVFGAIYSFMDGNDGEPPKISDLVLLLNSIEGLPTDGHISVGNGTVSSSLFRLEEIGLISMRRTTEKKKKRSAGSLRIIESDFTITISLEEAQARIRAFYNDKK